MANEYQEALIGSIDYLINNRISQLALDKTVVATVKRCTDATASQYRVSYSGGDMYAYAQEDASYTDGQSVYVLVPQGDFTQKKIIVGKASHVGTDGNINFISSTLNDYNLVGSNSVSEIAGFPLGLSSYLKEDFKLLYKRDIDDEGYTSLLSVDDDAVSTYIKESERVMLRVKVQTRLPKAHRTASCGEYGVQFVLAFKAKDVEDGDVKLASYTIDSSAMDGNPYIYTSPSSQYAIFDIDKDDFLYIDSIMAYSRDFVQEDDKINSDLYGDDIFISSIEFYGLKSLDAVNGDYRLQISAPNGTIYSGGASPNSELRIVGKLYYKGTDISDNAMYYWFKEDPRVSSVSSNYQMYGGKGWSYEKELGSGYSIAALKSDNRAYENRYLCVCVYKQQIILKTKFTVYNNDAKLNLSIESDIGTKFSFDRGKPNLTCLIDGRDEGFVKGKDDSLFRFLWSKIDDMGQITSYDKTVDELKEEYDRVLATDGRSYSTLVALKNQIEEMKDVEVDKNHLSYPVKGITNSATFQCSVYMRGTPESDEYYAGHAQIILYNDGVVQPTDYYILIENGNQVFQYSESGVAPDSDRYADPQEILPLYCHLYDPAGLEVDESVYSVKWRVPTSDTMLECPTELSINPANNRLEWFENRVFPTKIVGEFDYQATENQVVAIATYNGQEFQQPSNFSFIKVGDNGTNGTDVVCKVVPLDWEPQYDDEMFALQENKDGILIGSQQLGFEVYKSGVVSNEEHDVRWGVVGGSSRTYPLAIDADGSLSYKQERPTKVLSNRVVKGQITDDGQEYYAYFPVCSVQSIDPEYTLVLNKSKTLKQVLYNSDGRHPLYNKNQGIAYTLYKGEEEVSQDSFTSSWTAIGGIYDSDTSTTNTSLLSLQTDDGLVSTIKGFVGNFISVVPADTYSGEYCNNGVIGEISVGKNVVARVYYTLYVGLNRYGMSSLNGWDGNHIEINEDGNYILAPQVGAGVKNADNSFTGLVMGTAKSYDEDETVGLLGYCEGKQSIFLDAKTGRAVFGLPEDQSGQGDKSLEGRIELVPNGTSTISNWSIGSRSLYSMNTYDGTVSPFSVERVGSVIKVSYNEDNDNPVPVVPDKGYSDYSVLGSQISVPHRAQGMILNSAPAYLSIKGMPLTEKNSDIEWNGSNTTLRPEDSLEVEIDPKKSSLFSIYRHTDWEEREDGTYSRTHQEKQPDGTYKEVPNKYRRYPLVGINAYGQFYTNAVEDGNSSMSVGAVGAFKDGASSSRYVGAQFGYMRSNLLKFFIDTHEEGSDVHKTLHLSSGSDVSEEDGSEYVKPFHFHAKEVAMYTTDDKDHLRDETTSHKILINSSDAFIGHELSYLSIPEKQQAQLNTPNGIQASSGSVAGTIDGECSLTVSEAMSCSYGSMTANVSKDVVQTLATGSYKLTLSNNRDGITLTSKYNGITSSLLLNQSSAKVGITNASLELNGSKTSMLQADNGLDIVSKARPITIKNTGSSSGIEINAKWSDGDTGQARIKMLPASDGYSTISATTGNGTFTLGKKFASTDSIGGSTVSGSGLEVGPGVFTKYLVLTGTPNGENGGYSLLAKGSASVDFLKVANKDQNGNSVWIPKGGLSVEGVNTNGYSIQTKGDIFAGVHLRCQTGLIVDGYGMTKDWFEATANCRGYWRGGSFPRTDSEISNIASSVATPVAAQAASNAINTNTYTIHNSTNTIAGHINGLWNAIETLNRKVNGS